jgi:hypothetical protein
MSENSHPLPGQFVWRDSLCRDPHVGDTVIFVPHEGAEVIDAIVVGLHAPEAGYEFMKLDLQVPNLPPLTNIEHCNDVVKRYYPHDMTALHYASYWISRYELDHPEERFKETAS